MTNTCESAVSKPTPGHQRCLSLQFVSAGSKVPRYVAINHSRSSQRLSGDLLGLARNDVARLSKPRLALVQPTSGDMYVTKGGMSLRAIHDLHMIWLGWHICVPV